ncbi:hypothetical protein TEA_030024 [Camellia sinensis var. sinensis]|uniref:2-oxoacid dehydrogenase acyltransferase catalytic domain-containing protein n=1 Tax=Camellia sinensis var. sinensis TaxID=542762 RepID=A0A4S4DU87_CAMSN|nr:hypothetical protein TEA_030024 [Camellia sinensis var. sinensis]
MEKKGKFNWRVLAVMKNKKVCFCIPSRKNKKSENDSEVSSTPRSSSNPKSGGSRKKGRGNVTKDAVDGGRDHHIEAATTHGGATTATSSVDAGAAVVVMSAAHMAAMGSECGSSHGGGHGGGGGDGGGRNRVNLVVLGFLLVVSALLSVIDLRKSFCKLFFFQNLSFDILFSDVLYYVVAMKCRDRLHELVKEEIEKKDSSTDEWKIAMESSFNRMDNEAAAMALAQHPVVNTCKVGKSFTYNSSINIAVAVAINGALITPVLPRWFGGFFSCIHISSS